MTATRRSATKLENPQDYDLKRSVESIGRLYPVLTDPKGRIIDGMHRLSVDKNWPKHVVNSVSDERSFLVARLVTNVQRREVQPEEKKKMLKELAEETKWTPEEIAKHTGMSVSWVRKYLPSEFKNGQMAGLAIKKHKKPRKKISTQELPICSTCKSTLVLFHVCLECGEMTKKVFE